jgi:hypothetical protein
MCVAGLLSFGCTVRTAQTSKTPAPSVLMDAPAVAAIDVAEFDPQRGGWLAHTPPADAPLDPRFREDISANLVALH